MIIKTVVFDKYYLFSSDVCASQWGDYCYGNRRRK